MVFSFFDVQNPVMDRLRIRRFHGQVFFYSDARQKQAHKTHQVRLKASVNAMQSP